MSRIENIKALLESNEEIGRFFTLQEDDPESGLLLSSSTTVGKVQKKQRMFMRVRDGQSFCVLTAYICELDGEEDFLRVLPTLNRINAEYMGVRAYMAGEEENPDRKYSVVMSVENYFSAADEDPNTLFMLDQLLTRAIEAEYDAIMKSLYS